MNGGENEEQSCIAAKRYSRIPGPSILCTNRYHNHFPYHYLAVYQFYRTQDHASPNLDPRRRDPTYRSVLILVTTSSAVQFDEAMTMNTTLGTFTHNEPAIGDQATGTARTAES